MSRKTLIYLGAFIGSILGGYLPSLWGSGEFSVASLLLGTIGGIAGVLLAARLTR